DYSPEENVCRQQFAFGLLQIGDDFERRRIQAPVPQTPVCGELRIYCTAAGDSKSCETGARSDVDWMRHPFSHLRITIAKPILRRGARWILWRSACTLSSVALRDFSVRPSCSRPRRSWLSTGRWCKARSKLPFAAGATPSLGKGVALVCSSSARVAVAVDRA